MQLSRLPHRVNEPQHNEGHEQHNIPVEHCQARPQFAARVASGIAIPLVYCLELFDGASKEAKSSLWSLLVALSPRMLGLHRPLPARLSARQSYTTRLP